MSEVKKVDKILKQNKDYFKKKQQEFEENYKTAKEKEKKDNHSHTYKKE